jgi:hypothetical protein
MEETPFHSGKQRTPDGMPGGAISLSAAWDKNGIVWALIPNKDGQYVTVDGHFVAYDAESLDELYYDDDPVAFAKFNPPLAVGGHVIRPTFADKVMVYALAKPNIEVPPFLLQPLQPIPEPSPGPDPAPLRCYTIDEKYQVLGGPSGTLGTPSSAVIELADGGEVRHFDGFESLGGTCSAPETLKRVPIETAVYWSQKTCAHVVQGDALALWNELGAQAGTLGYPLTDEVPTRDGAGRRIVFEHGEIRWTPERGYEACQGQGCPCLGPGCPFGAQGGFTQPPIPHNYLASATSSPGRKE